MNRPAVTAHSGCEHTPDNSIQSLETAIHLGADCAEVDVRLDSRDVLRLTHDRPADYSDIPTLEEAFRVAAANAMGINCDLKEYDALTPTLRLADEQGLAPDLLFFSGSLPIEQLLKDKGVARRARLLLNSEEVCAHLSGEKGLTRREQSDYIARHVADVAALMENTGATALNAPYEFISPELFDALRRAGIELSLWTVNDEQALARLMREDVFNITTRAPSLALRLRNRP